MRKILFLLLLLLPFTSMAEIIKLKALSMSTKECSKHWKTWGKWSEWTSIDVIIVLDTDKDQIKIFLDETIIFDIIKKHDPEPSDNNTTTLLQVEAVDNKGLRCGIRLLLYDDDNDKLQLYIDYNNIIYAFNIAHIS